MGLLRTTPHTLARSQDFVARARQAMTLGLPAERNPGTGVDHRAERTREPGEARQCALSCRFFGRSAGFPGLGGSEMDVPTTPHEPVSRGARVLVVDDEPVMRQFVRRLLEGEGFEVEAAPNGETALRLVQATAEPFDLVLTDLSMPGIDGRRVSETVRRYRPTVAVLCMSANPDAVPYVESEDTPVRVLLKPFSADDLYHAVRDAITRARDLTAIAEADIVRAHTGLSQHALALEASRTMRVQTVDLVVAARELRRVAAAQG